MKYIRVYLRALKIPYRGEKRLTVTLVAASVLVGMIQMAEPVLFGRVIDALTAEHNVYQLLIVWGSIGVTNILASVFLAVMSDRLAHRQRLSTLDQVFERAIALPASYHSEKGSGKVVHAIMSGTDQLFTLWLSFLREHLASLVGILALIPLATSMDWQMSALLFTLASVYLIANFRVAKGTYARQEQVVGYQHTLYSRVGDVIGNVTVVQSYARLMEEIRELQRITSNLLRAQYPILTWWGILSVITRISSTLTMVLILSLGSWRVMKGELSVGEVVAFVSFSGLLIQKLEQVSGFLSRTITQAPHLQRFFELVDEGGEAAMETPYAKPILHVKGDVEFSNVSYRHKGGSAGVFDLNFKVEAGQVVALVGPSGSGKSTTMALLQRQFDVQEGQVTIDGHDVREFTLNSLRAAIATVFQESGLFNRSIMENIRVGRPNATDEEVVRAAEQADAHDFIMTKPGGYHFIIGERGVSLSGGERQRVAIARAILKDSPILVFDEATSALDNESEKKIQSQLAQFREQKKTTFIIAHRLSTVVSADKILVFDRGRIVESGTFDELQGKGGLFARLVHMGELKPELNRGGLREVK